MVKPGQLYCGEHAIYDSNNNDDDVDDCVDVRESRKNRRIPCPLDPKHTVNESELNDHIRRCNARLPQEPWIVSGINTFCHSVGVDPLSNIYEVKEKDLAAKVEQVYEIVTGKHGIDILHLNCPSIDSELAAHSDYGPTTRKHLIQVGSIIGHFQRTFNLLTINGSNEGIQVLILSFVVTW